MTIGRHSIPTNGPGIAVRSPSRSWILSEPRHSPYGESYEDTRPRTRARELRLTFDILGATVELLVLSPLLLIVAAGANRFEGSRHLSPGAGGKELPTF